MSEKYPPALQKLLEDVNLPLIQVLLREVVVHDHICFENLFEGFPVLGSLPEVNYGGKPMPEAKQHMLSQEWLREIREANNRKVITKIKESEYSEDVWQQTNRQSRMPCSTGWHSRSRCRTTTLYTPHFAEGLQ